jgi:MoaA/NifB/PqqE/SkfB family radical SAM enzyme/SAM-dependent methyltransferase
MKALLKVGYGCNDHCTFCHTLDVREVQGSDGEVRRKILRAKELGHTMVVLSGGEPTIRPELMAWAEYAAELDLDFGLVTNGRLLAYPDVVEELIERRLRYVYLSLHGGSRRVHDLLVRARAFGETYGALKNLSGTGVELHVNCVVTKQNVKKLRELVDAVLPYPDATLKMSMVEPKGGGDKHFRRLTPTVTEVAEMVADAIRYGEQKRGDAAGPRFAHGAIPLCLMPGLEDRYDDLKTHRYATMVEVGEGDFFPVDDRNKVQPEPCRGCALAGPCPGLYKGYHEAFGHEELEPVPEGPRANSFDYVLESVIEDGFGPGGCALRDGPLGVTPWDRGRHLFVRHQGKLARFRATTRDFSDVAIDATKHELGQIYYDISGKVAPDDFGRDLVPLRPAAVCGECPERPHCAGMVEPLMEKVFAEDEAELEALLGELEGDVLDVGCGDGRSRSAPPASAKAGRIRYTGVDPDGEALRTLAKAHDWATLHEGTAEALPIDDERRFDHVLLLRSWNHLREARAVARSLWERLRPGGSLLIVDDVPFGLARTRQATQRARASTAEWEHLRNDDASMALGRLDGLEGATLALRRDVGIGTSNRWILRLVRESPARTAPEPRRSEQAEIPPGRSGMRTR